MSSLRINAGLYWSDNGRKVHQRKSKKILEESERSPGSSVADDFEETANSNRLLNRLGRIGAILRVSPQ